MATETQTTDVGATLAGTLGVYSQTDYPILISAPTHFIYATLGGISFVIQDISTDGWAGPDPQPSPPLGTQLTFAIYIHNGTNAEPVNNWNTHGHEFVYMTDADDDDLERAFSLSVTGQRLWRAESTRYGQGRDGKPVFADDVDYADSWVAISPTTWVATFGSLSYSGTQTEDPTYGWIPDVNPINALSIYFEQHKGQDWLKYAAATDLQWSAVNMDFSGMSKLYGTAPPSGTGTKVTGSVGGLELTCKNTAQVASTWQHGLPLIADLHPNVWDREGNLVENARLALPIQASWEVPASFDWSTTP